MSPVSLWRRRTSAAPTLGLVPSLPAGACRIPARPAKTVMTLLTLAAGLLAGTAAPAHAAVSVPATPEPGKTVGTTTPVAYASFPAGRRFVTAIVYARSAPGASEHLMLAAILTCGAQSTLSGVNITAGQGWVSPRRIFSDARSCRVDVQSALGKTAADRLLIDVSWSSEPVQWGAEGYVPDAQPTLLGPSQRHDAVPVTLKVPGQAGHVKIRGDARLTACTTWGGSRENGSENLCLGRVNTAGTRVRVELIVQQFAQGGGYCQSRVLSGKTIFIDKWLHHAEVYQAGTFTLSRASGCLPTVRVKLRVIVLSGADLVVHRHGTLTSIFR
jgi:hypothetical protein